MPSGSPNCGEATPYEAMVPTVDVDCCDGEAWNTGVDTSPSTEGESFCVKLDRRAAAEVPADTDGVLSGVEPPLLFIKPLK